MEGDRSLTSALRFGSSPTMWKRLKTVSSSKLPIVASDVGRRDYRKSYCRQG